MHEGVPDGIKYYEPTGKFMKINVLIQWQIGT